MSLHVAAQHLASKGRDGDSMLVHMSPGEVKGLQALAMAHGGSLSINPDTGLAEASFLKRILPTIAGIGLNMMFPGSGALIGAGIGAFETARTGDIGKGLMAGLGAYGGANLGSALSGAGQAVSGLESGANALGVAPETLRTTAGMTDALQYTDFDTLGGLDPTKVTNFADAYAKGAAPATTTAGQFSQMGQGLKDVTSSGQAAMDFGKRNLMDIGAASAPVLAGAMTPKTEPIPGAPEEEERYKGAPYRYNLSPNFSGYVPRQPKPYYTPTGLGYAEGGDVMTTAGGAYEDEPMSDNPGMAAGGIAGYAAGGLKMKTMSPGEGIYRDTDEDTASLGAYDAAMKRMKKQYAAANLKPKEMPKSGIAKLGQMKAMASGGLGGYSDGGRMLKGPGDGMSDNIPAVIGKKQPARLADGEFVVPADVVSHLGNGSTDAGAKKLYSMMDKVRTARTGKKKQAPAVKVDKYMPA
jgi:hypothetical protein